jgi:cytochrome c oxidase accessory protein FixG
LSKKPHSGPFQIAPKEDLLYSVAVDGSRNWIDPVLTKGRYWRVRLVVGCALILVFLGLPHIEIVGKPGIFLDFAQRQFTFIGVTLHPTDNLILLAFGLLTAITVIGLTAIYGRIWCGYGCPHPIYLEFIFRPIERWLEGSPAKRRRRKAGGWNADRAWRVGLKLLLYVLIAVFLSTTFISYFIGWGELWERLLTDPLKHRGMLFALSGFTALILFNFANFRDQMCTVACPYGRLQSVLYDQDTVIVGYDPGRGEPRGNMKARKGEENHGDCIDCGLCITTCPTGMDIRRGLQMECIGCAQCVEACDVVMAKIKKPPGLIRYTSERELETGAKQFWRLRLGIYGLVGAVAATALLVLTFGRGGADVEILRTAREPFRMLPTEEVANLLRVRLTNQLHEAQAFTVEIVEPAGAELVVSQSPFVVEADRVGTVDVVAKMPATVFERGQATGIFIIRSDKDLMIEKEFVLLGPY